MPKPIVLRYVLATALVAWAVTGAPPAAEVSPRVYTNADLSDLPPIPTQDEPLAAFDAEAWSRVASWLDSEHARLDAELERRHEAELATRGEPTPRPAAFRSFSGFYPYRPVPARPPRQRASRPDRSQRPRIRPDLPDRQGPIVRERRAPRMHFPRQD